MRTKRISSKNLRTSQLGLTLVFALFSAVSGNSQKILDRHVLHDIRIEVSQESWFDSLQTYFNQALNGADNRFLPATVITDGDTLYEVGFRFKGKYSNYGFPGNKKPFRLDFNEFIKGQDFQGLKKLNLHNLAGDPSFLREFMAYDLFAYLGIAAPRVSFTRLYINNVYWGCYEIVEEPDKVFLAHNFGNKNGNLFECVKTSTLSWKGELPAAYPELELKTDSSATAYDNLIEWLDLFNNYYSFNYQQQLSERFDMDSYMRILAADVLINNQDAYWSNGRNYFIYDDLVFGKLRWIPWDYNLSFWDASHAPIPVHSGNVYQPFIYRIYENDYLRKKYLTQFCKLIENEFNDYPFNERSQEVYALIRPAVEEDSMKFYTTYQFYANRTQPVTVSMLRNNIPTDVYLPGLTDLFAKRRTELRKALFAAGCDCDNIEVSDELEGTLFPNPATKSVTIYLEDDISSGRMHIRLSDMSGNILFNEYQTASTGSFQCDISGFSNGVYFVKVESQGKSFTRRLIKY